MQESERYHTRRSLRSKKVAGKDYSRLGQREKLNDRRKMDVTIREFRKGHREAALLVADEQFIVQRLAKRETIVHYRSVSTTKH